MIEIRSFEVAPCHDRVTGEATTDFKISQFYINLTDHDVCVINRNNVPITVRCWRNTQYDTANLTGSINKYTFRIRQVIHIKTRDGVISAINNLEKMKEYATGSSEVLMCILEQLHLNFNASCMVSGCTISIDFDFHVEELKKYPRIYNHQTDVMLQLDHQPVDCPHPYSLEGDNREQYKKLLEERTACGILVEVVDNENNINDRYIYVGKKLVSIAPTKDPTRNSGVYTSFIENTKMGDILINPEFSSFEDAEERFGICKSKEDAITAGDASLLLRNKALELETQLLDTKNEIEHLRTTNQYQKEKFALEAEERARRLHELEVERTERENQTHKEKSKLESELALAKAEVEKAKLKSAKIKEKYERKKASRDDYYEDRSHKRKDTTELVKFIPALLIGAAATYAAIKARN